MFHEHLLRRAIALALEPMLAGEGGPFGAVVAHGEQVVAEGWNRVTSSLDPTAHAEVEAIRRACQKLGRFDLAGFTLYASCEPCPMCLAACYWARLDSIWFACDRQQAAAAGFDDAVIYRELALPLACRTLPVRQMMIPDSEQPFRAWLQKADRRCY